MQQLSFLVQNISHSIFLISDLSLEKFSSTKQSASGPASWNSILLAEEKKKKDKNQTLLCPDISPRDVC